LKIQKTKIPNPVLKIIQAHKGEGEMNKKFVLYPLVSLLLLASLLLSACGAPATPVAPAATQAPAATEARRCGSGSPPRRIAEGGAPRCRSRW